MNNKNKRIIVYCLVISFAILTLAGTLLLPVLLEEQSRQGINLINQQVKDRE